jgi:hypothetical protein
VASRDQRERLIAKRQRRAGCRKMLLDTTDEIDASSIES